MKPTYISRPVQVLDVPVPSKPQVKFVYNFFEADERVDDNPPRLKKPLSALTPREISIKIPRYVVVDWKKPRFDPMRSRDLVAQRDFLEEHRQDIANESTILVDSSMLYFQDFDYLSRVGERFESSARVRGLLSGSSTDVAHKLMLQRNKFAASGSNISTEVNAELESKVIQRYLSVASQSRSLFVSGDSLIEPADASAADQLAIIIDNDYVTNLSRESQVSPVASCAAVTRANSKMMAGRYGKRSTKMLREQESELELASIDDIPVKDTSNIEKIEHVGYVIDRFEIAEGDRVGKLRNFYISSPNVSNFLDANVKYGVQYVYSIRSVAAFYVTAVNDNNELQKSKFLIASRPSTFSSILTEEYVPPPPPADLNFRWDYQRAALQIDWAFPSNPQRDIKGWQIFRRRNTSEAFALIAQLDFDDSVIKTPPAESISKSLIKKYDSSITFYVEPEFDKDSSYIYAVCSIDAHAMTSNYSAQFHVKFDRIQNRLIKTLLSTSGAPKQYPNTFLKTELSLDSVKSSKSDRIRIYFDPEYLQVNDRRGRDLHLLKTDSRSGVYRFMLLNTDRQKQANIDVTLKDLRNLRQDGSSGKE
jgi:hypothetical protein